MAKKNTARTAAAVIDQPDAPAAPVARVRSVRKPHPAAVHQHPSRGDGGNGPSQPTAQARAARRAAEERNAAAHESTDVVDVEYPCVKYRKAPVTPRTPHGYEVRKVRSPEEAALLPKGWVDSPDDV